MKNSHSNLSSIDALADIEILLLFFYLFVNKNSDTIA